MTSIKSRIRMYFVQSAPTILIVAILGVIALIYWPVHEAGFVWIDKICFHNAAWLRSGDGWKQLVFHSFYEWINYFRPLVVALFVLEVRAFDVSPGPMHLVSLVIHLANTLLVGLLAMHLHRGTPGAKAPPRFATGIAMLLYGLHPALIEPVVWISCQFELVVTFFMLLGLLLNATVRQSAIRAVTVGACFFLAAGAKESAVSFPLMLVVFDWMRRDQADQGFASGLRMLWRRQGRVYACVLAAGLAYLAMRYLALGFLVQPNGGQPLFSASRLQAVGYLYLTYWRIIVWPMVGLGPIHLVDAHRFSMLGAQGIAIVSAAAAIFFGGLYLAWKRKPLGFLTLAVTAALLPVLHIVPIDFDTSLYHERYAMTAIATACALLPWILASISLPAARLKMASFAATAVAVAWLGLAVINIKVTLPLWSNETKLWLWELREHPDSLDAKDHLLSTYLEIDDRPHARHIADELMVETRPCPNCMVNIANLALVDGDLARAASALEKARRTIPRQGPKSLVQSYMLAIGLLCEMKHDLPGAEQAYRAAIAMEPLDPQAQMNLASLLARQGKVDEARKRAQLALALFAPDQRAEKRRQFEGILAASGAPSGQ